MKTFCFALVAMVLFAVIAHSVTINTTRSNIRHGMDATWSAADSNKVKIVFTQSSFDAADKKSYASGHFMLEVDFQFTKQMCTEMKAPEGLTMKAGTYTISHVGNSDVCYAAATVNTSRSNIKR